MSRARLLHARTAAADPAFWGRLAKLNVGLAVMGLGLAVVLSAGVGLGPWAVFHEGVALATGLSFGRVLQLAGVAVLALSWWWTGERPGVGTFLNMAIVGPWVDLFAASAWMPAPGSFGLGALQFVVGTTLIGVASGVYITAGLGAGPRDGFVLGLSRVLGASVRRVRSGLELTVLVVGFLLGGTVGLGTLVFALLIGPIMQFSIRVFRRPALARA